MDIRSVTYAGFTALLLAGLIGCGSKPIDGPVSKVSDLVAVCGGRHAPTAAPFAGAPPHPILVVPPQGAIEDILENTRFQQLGPAWNPQDPTAVQLVACTQSDGGGMDSGLLCPYPFGKSASLRYANYTVTVYEARSATTVGKAHIEARDTCPLTAAAHGQQPVVYAVPSAQQYRDALGGFVNRR
ncbi:MAG TPA: hypothetical protein VFN75_04670 [Pseudonocardiaceae bacterium]|nr:hypothetical protein [Pseudonocardiaceae bacterium]